MAKNRTVKKDVDIVHLELYDPLALSAEIVFKLELAS